MRLAKNFILLTLAGWLLVGCYPDEKAANEAPLYLSGLALPLTEVGIQLEAEPLQRWLTWAEGGFDGEAFDMGTDGNDFALYLRLFDENGWPVSFAGESLNLVDDGGQEHLLVACSIGVCSGCRFELALFWRDLLGEGQPVRVFYGESDVFTALQQGDLPDGVSATIFERATGRVRVLEGSSDVAGLDGAWVAARDPIANVRLPHTQVQSGNAIPAILTGVPLDREMTIELDPLADGRFYAPFAAITLDVPEGVVNLP